MSTYLPTFIAGLLLGSKFELLKQIDMICKKVFGLWGDFCQTRISWCNFNFWWLCCYQLVSFSYWTPDWLVVFGSQMHQVIHLSKLFCCQSSCLQKMLADLFKHKFARIFFLSFWFSLRLVIVVSMKMPPMPVGTKCLCNKYQSACMCVCV